MTCERQIFKTVGKVARVEDIGRFVLEMQVHCVECGKPFQFLGLKPGINYDGATVSLDGLELNVGICPEGQRPYPMQILMGYELMKVN